MKNLIINKKGDIPVTLLVIGVFAICSLALLTFFISDFKISNSFVGIEMMNKMNTMSEEYVFYSDRGSIDNLESYFNWTEENGQRFLYLEKSYDKFVFSKLKKEKMLLFSIKYPAPVK